MHSNSKERITKGLVFAFDLPPVAVAVVEWINGDQQGELFEALAEFSHCRRSSFRHWGPTQWARDWGALFLLTFLVRAKRVRRLA